MKPVTELTECPVSRGSVPMEPITRKQVTTLLTAIGIHATPYVDWHKIDYEVGRGKGEGECCHYLWTTDGFRIEIDFRIDTTGKPIKVIQTLEQTLEPDPEYARLRAILDQKKAAEESDLCAEGGCEECPMMQVLDQT